MLVWTDVNFEIDIQVHKNYGAIHSRLNGYYSVYDHYTGQMG